MAAIDSKAFGPASTAVAAMALPGAEAEDYE